MVTAFSASETYSQLDLDADQQSKIRPIVDRTHEKLFAIRKRMDPEVEQVIKDGMAEADPILRAEQQAELRALVQKIGKAWGTMDKASEPAGQH